MHCGAFKKFGRSTAELKFGSSAATLDKYPNYENLTHVTVSSPEVIWAYEEAMHLPKGIVKATGVSRTDLFYDSEFVESRRQKLYEIMPEAKDKKVIMLLLSVVMLLLPNLQIKLILNVFIRNLAMNMSLSATPPIC